MIKRICYVFVLVLLVAIPMQAQAIPTLEPFEDETFGLMGVRPAEWNRVQPGIYVEGEAFSSMTRLAVQGSPGSNATLASSLANQFGLEGLPEADGQIVTDFGTWTTYQVTIADADVALSMALTEREGTSTIVILQSSIGDHPALREAVFLPVVESVMALPDPVIEPVPYTQEDVTISNGDVTLAGTLSIPEDAGEVPVLLILSGSGPQTRTGNISPLMDLEPYTEIADYLTRNGIAVLRLDDRGFGGSSGNPVAVTLADLASDATAAVNYLASRGQFSHIGVAGHSEGGMYAPEVALTNDNVDFVIGLAAPTAPFEDVILQQQRAVLEANGFAPDALEEVDAAYRAVLEQVDQGATGTDLNESVRNLMSLQSGGNITDEMVVQGVRQFDLPLLRSYLTYDNTEFWTSLDVPALAIYGGNDIQVNAQQNIAPIEGQDNITVVTIPAMNHIFQEAETGTLSEYFSLEQTVMPELLDTLTSWIQSTATQ